MKQIILFLSLFVAGLLQAQQGGANLLQSFDPSCEDCIHSTPCISSEYWGCDQCGESGIALNVNRRNSGRKSLHLYTSESNPQCNFSRAKLKKMLPINPTETYKIGCRVSKPSGYDWQEGSKVFIEVIFLDKEQGFLGKETSNAYTAPSSSWSLLEISDLQPPKEASHLTFKVILEKPKKIYGQSIVNLDDFFVEVL